MSSEPSKKTTNTSQVSKPIAAQAPIYQSIWDKTSGAVQDFTPFSGDVVAGATPNQQQGAQAIATAPVGTNAAATADMARKVAGGFFLDPNNDPTFQGTVNAAIDPITRNLQQKVLPGIIDKSIRVGGTGGGPGAYGGASQSLEEGNAVADWGRTAANTTAQLANASRNAGINLIPQIPQLNAGANAEALAAPQAAVTGGTLQQQFEQMKLDNEVQKWQMNQNSTLPFLQQAASILGMGGFGDRSGTSEEIGSAPSVAAQWMQGLAGGAGVANSLFGAPKGGTSAVTGIMSMLSALSDARLKTDVKAVGKTFDGQTIYRYRFGNLPTFHLGLLAQEVEQVTPMAVEDQLGWKTVDYKMATDVAVGMGA